MRLNAILVTVIFALVPAARAATLVVDGAPCTLTDAILSANADADVGSCVASGGYGADTLLIDADVVLTAADTVNSESQGTNGGDFAGLPTVDSEMTIEARGASVVERQASLGCDEEDPDGFRILTVVGAGNLTLNGLTIRGGCAASGGEGGAIFLGGGTELTISGSVFSDNTARASARGGAIATRGGSTLTISGSRFVDNRAESSVSASAEGGALRILGALPSLVGSEFVFNVAENFASNAEGGAIWMGSGAASVGPIVATEFRSNRALAGMGGSARGGAVFVTRNLELWSENVVSANQAIGGGSTTIRGGAAHGGGAYLRDVDVLANSLFEDNVAWGGDSSVDDGGGAGGGGLNFSGGDGVVASLVIVGNVARGGDGAVNGGAGFGGGLLGRLPPDGQTTLSGNSAVGGTGGSGVGGSAHGGGWNPDDDDVQGAHHTIVDNEVLAGSGGGGAGAALGGGLYMTDSYTFSLSSSLISNNRATPAGGASTANDCDWEAGVVDESGGYNLIEAPGSCTLTMAATDVTGVDPGVLSVGNNSCLEILADGRCAPSVAFASDKSAAIDVGSCSTSGATADTRGFDRPFDVQDVADLDDGCDIGSFEWVDLDLDGAEDGTDNCEFLANPDQLDGDWDGLGDSCDACEGDNSTGDPDMDGICADRDCSELDGAGISCWIFGDGFESGDTSRW